MRVTTGMQLESPSVDGGEPAAEPPVPPARPKGLFCFYCLIISLSFFILTAKQLFNAPSELAHLTVYGAYCTTCL